MAANSPGRTDASLQRLRLIGLVGPVAFAMAALNATDPFADLLRRAHRGERLLWFDEGVQTTVSVHRRPGTAGIMRVMYLDGMHQADDSGGTAFTHHSPAVPSSTSRLSFV